MGVIRNRQNTKILATIGPSSQTPAVIEDLTLAGADGFRLNCSHGTHEFFRSRVADIRSVAQKLERPIAILQDLQGPKIRVGRLTGGKPVQLIPGAKFVITAREIEGNELIISTTYPSLPRDVRPGDKILIDDGSLELKVQRVNGDDIETEVIIGGTLKEKKGINLPGIKVSAPSMTEKDIVDASLGIELDVDYMALSFVRTASDVHRLREILSDHKRNDIKVIAKIEKPEAVRNLKEILDAADGVMVARGDLGVEMPAGKIPLIQKKIIEKSNQADKLVITATQMLESMVDRPKPTRAEASDVANAILDGTDVVMLSQETAVGLYPSGAVKTMAQIAGFTEEDEGVFAFTERIRPQKLVTFTHAIVHSARVAAEILKAKAILVFTQSGTTAALASSQRPPCPIFAFTPFRKTYQQLALVWGVTAILMEETDNTEYMIEQGEQILLNSHTLQKGDPVVIVSGSQRLRGATNMMKIERLGQ